MKHLKTFENNASLYKKYIVADFSPYHSKESMLNSHYIFKVLPNSTEDILYYDEFSSVSDGKLITRESYNCYKNYKDKTFDILYQTDSLEDASDFLCALQDADKYNL